MKVNFPSSILFWSMLVLSIANAVPVPQNSTDIQSSSNVCSYEGHQYQEGQNRPTIDPCEICTCIPPSFTCSIRKCDSKPGCKATHAAGKCCPDYVCDCNRNGRTYGNGEKMEEPNPCNVCYCLGGEIKCTGVECYTRDDCEPHYVAGKCCPKYDHCPIVLDPKPSEEPPKISTYSDDVTLFPEDSTTPSDRNRSLVGTLDIIEVYPKREENTPDFQGNETEDITFSSIENSTEYHTTLSESEDEKFLDDLLEYLDKKTNQSVKRQITTETDLEETPTTEEIFTTNIETTSEEQFEDELISSTTEKIQEETSPPETPLVEKFEDETQDNTSSTITVEVKEETEEEETTESSSTITVQEGTSPPETQEEETTESSSTITVQEGTSPPETQEKETTESSTIKEETDLPEELATTKDPPKNQEDTAATLAEILLKWLQTKRAKIEAKRNQSEIARKLIDEENTTSVNLITALSSGLMKIAHESPENTTRGRSLDEDRSLEVHKVDIENLAEALTDGKMEPQEKPEKDTPIHLRYPYTDESLAPVLSMISDQLQFLRIGEEQPIYVVQPEDADYEDSTPKRERKVV